MIFLRSVCLGVRRHDELPFAAYICREEIHDVLQKVDGLAKLCVTLTEEAASMVVRLETYVQRRSVLKKMPCILKPEGLDG